jgi:hypothetical protein
MTGSDAGPRQPRRVVDSAPWPGLCRPGRTVPVVLAAPLSPSRDRVSSPALQ